MGSECSAGAASARKHYFLAAVPRPSFFWYERHTIESRKYEKGTKKTSRITAWKIAADVLRCLPPMRSTVAMKSGAKIAPRFRTRLHDGGCGTRLPAARL